ncbi:MAG: hypothetical protein ACRDTH_00505 [Pseudonocardiaceae bacterium]
MPTALARLGPARTGPDRTVESGALGQRPPERLDDRSESRLVQALPVARPRRTADVLVHERATEVVHPGPQQLAAPEAPSFTQDACTWSINPCNAIRATACTSSTSRQVGPRRAARLRYIGVAMCTNRRAAEHLQRLPAR